MTARNRVGTGFGLPILQQLKLPDVLAAVFVTALIGVGLNAALTMWFADQLHYQEALGRVLFRFGTTPVYGPLRWLDWRQELASRHPELMLVRTTEHALLLITTMAITAGAWSLFERHRTANDKRLQLHGSAHWATREEVLDTGLVDQSSGVILGYYKDPRSHSDRILRLCGPDHVLVVGPPREGKDLMLYSSVADWDGSTLILDPRGETWERTSKHLESIGHRVIRIEPGAEAGTVHRFNPLVGIRLGTFREVADAQQIATSWLDSDGKKFEGDNGIFTQSARPLLAAGFLHVLYRAKRDGRPRAGMPEVQAEFWHPSKSVEEVLTEWMEFEHDPTFSRGWVTPDGESTATHPMIASSANAVLGLDPRTRSSVLFALRAALELLQDENLAQNLAASDFALEDFANADKPMAIYVVFPPLERQRLAPVLRSIIEQIVYRHMQKVVTDNEGVSRSAHRHPIDLILNEFAELGRMETLEKALPICGGFGIRAVLAAQDLSQIRKYYGREQSILALCKLRVFFPPGSWDTAEEISKTIGETTIQKSVRSTSAQAGKLLENVNSSETEERRRLISADEIMRMPVAKKDKSQTKILKAGSVLVVMRGRAPIFAWQYLPWEDDVIWARVRKGAARLERTPAAKALPRPRPAQQEAQEVAAPSLPSSFDPDEPPRRPSPPSRLSLDDLQDDDAQHS